MKAVAPLVVRPGKATPLSLDGRQYRGKLEVAPQGRFLRIVNVTPLEGYLQGVVANEMPHSWPLEALKAQAVAGRSYALATIVKGKSFDLYSDVRSQVYEGVAGEQPRTTEAVRATAGQVLPPRRQARDDLLLLELGREDGERTRRLRNRRPVPPVETRPVGQGLALPPLGARADRRAHASVQARPRRPCAGCRRRRDTLRTTSLLHRPVCERPLEDAGGAPAYGPRAPLDVGHDRRAPARRACRARGLRRRCATHRHRARAPAPVLASSQGGSTWTPVGPLQRETSGVASLVVKPERTLRYRIEVSGAASPPILLRVAPRVQLAQAADGTGLTGTVRPRLAGATVFVERRRGSSWTQVAQTTVDKAGAFRVELAVLPGSYRARVVRDGGFRRGSHGRPHGGGMTMLRRAPLLLAVLGIWLAVPEVASAARVAIGLDRLADSARVATAVERGTGTRPDSLAPIPALVVDVPYGVSLRDTRRPLHRAARDAPPLAHADRPARRPPVVPDPEPVLRAVADDAALDPVTVAVIDSGVDASHPELSAASSGRRASSAARPGSTPSATGPSSRGSSRRASTTGSGSRALRPRPSCSSPRS